MDPDPNEVELTSLQKIALTSIVVGILVLALKSLAAWLTGSVALLSDALESIVNVAAAILAFAAITYSALPADSNHPYGHHKAEYLSAMIEALLIGGAAIAILFQVWASFAEPRIVFVTTNALLLNAAAGIINAIWCLVLLRKGRAMRSPALVADGRHLLTDVYSSIGVLGGVIIARATGLWWLDPLLALFVAGNIIWTGWSVLMESAGGLMDESPARKDIDAIHRAISIAGQGAIQAHDLRARRAGNTTFIEFHLIVPGEMTVTVSHDICDRIEQALTVEFGIVQTVIHVEPEGHAKSEAIILNQNS